MKKILFFILLFYFLVILQGSFLVHFTVGNIVPNLVLISVVIFNFFEKSRKNTGFLVAVIAGFYLDLYSAFPMGVFILSLLLLTFLIKKFFKFIGEENFFYFIFSLFFSLIFYRLFLFICDSFLRQSFYFNFNKLQLVELGYNFILGVLVFYFVKIWLLRKIRK